MNEGEKVGYVAGSVMGALIRTAFYLSATVACGRYVGWW